LNVVHPPGEGDQDSSEKAIRIHRKGESQITSKRGHYLTFFPKKMNFGNLTIKQRFYQIITDISYPSLCNIQAAAEFLNLCQSLQILANFMVEPKDNISSVISSYQVREAPEQGISRA
jgi:hypothetical protein